MMEILFRDEGSVKLVYKGFEIEVGFTCLEPEDQLPGFIVRLPHELAVSCWGDGLTMAPSLFKDSQHIRVASELCIPLELKESK
jgi:hypothetical protein